MIEFLILIIFLLAAYGFILNKGKAKALSMVNVMHSQPHYLDEE